MNRAFLLCGELRYRCKVPTEEAPSALRLTRMGISLARLKRFVMLARTIRNHWSAYWRRSNRT